MSTTIDTATTLRAVQMQLHGASYIFPNPNSHLYPTAKPLTTEAVTMRSAAAAPKYPPGLGIDVSPTSSSPPSSTSSTSSSSTAVHAPRSITRSSLIFAQRMQAQQASPRVSVPPPPSSDSGAEDVLGGVVGYAEMWRQGQVPPAPPNTCELTLGDAREENWGQGLVGGGETRAQGRIQLGPGAFEVMDHGRELILDLFDNVTSIFTSIFFLFNYYFRRPHASRPRSRRTYRRCAIPQCEHCDAEKGTEMQTYRFPLRRESPSDVDLETGLARRERAGERW